jgi:hypothetical protein
MSGYRFIWEKGSKKHTCPQCKTPKKFNRYIDIETGDYLPEHFGYCERTDSCGYKCDPYKENYIKELNEKEKIYKFKRYVTKPKPKPKPIFFPFEIYNKSLNQENYNNNMFIQNLLHRVKHPFHWEDIQEVIELYKLGTISKDFWAGAIAFPFIDSNNNIRAVQVKKFDKSNHTTDTSFLHSIIEKFYSKNKKPKPNWLTNYISQESRNICLFGDHLINKNNKPIILVEAPKTAIYGHLYFYKSNTALAGCNWLAVGAKGYLTLERVKTLKGRESIVFPDCSTNGNTFIEWQTKFNKFEDQLSGTSFILSNYLEEVASDEQKAKGIDIADILINLDWRLLREDPQPEPITTYQNDFINSDFSTTDIDSLEFNLEPNNKTEDWSEIISELHQFFADTQSPTKPIKIDSASTVINYQMFVIDHLEAIIENNGDPYFKRYVDRLQALRAAVIREGGV